MLCTANETGCTLALVSHSGFNELLYSSGVCIRATIVPSERSVAVERCEQTMACAWSRPTSPMARKSSLRSASVWPAPTTAVPSPLPCGNTCVALCRKNGPHLGPDDALYVDDSSPSRLWNALWWWQPWPGPGAKPILDRAVLVPDHSVRPFHAALPPLTMAGGFIRWLSWLAASGPGRQWPPEVLASIGPEFAGASWRARSDSPMVARGTYWLRLEGARLSDGRPLRKARRSRATMSSAFRYLSRVVLRDRQNLAVLNGGGRAHHGKSR